MCSIYGCPYCLIQINFILLFLKRSEMVLCIIFFFLLITIFKAVSFISMKINNNHILKNFGEYYIANYIKMCWLIELLFRNNNFMINKQLCCIRFLIHSSW